MKVRIFHLNKAGERRITAHDLDEAAQWIVETSLKKQLWIEQEGARGNLQSVVVVETWHDCLIGSWIVQARTQQDLLVQLNARLMILVDDYLEPGLPEGLEEAMHTA